MRKHGTDDDDLVVVEDAFVDLDRHVQFHAALGQFARVRLGKRADGAQRGGIVPLVIEAAHVAIGARALGGGDFQPPANRRLTHRLVRAQRDENVERARHRAELPVQRLKHQPHRRGARAVGDDEQHLLPAIRVGGTGLGDEVGDAGRGDGGTFRSGGSEHFHGSILATDETWMKHRKLIGSRPSVFNLCFIRGQIAERLVQEPLCSAEKFPRTD